MALRDFQKVPYLPILEVRPAEMAALQELPEKDKMLLMPLFKLRPWTSAHRLSSALDRIKSSYGDRPCLLSLGGQEFAQHRRDVHDELDALRVPDGGFEAWCEFFERDGCKNFVPVLQLTDPDQFDAQAERLVALGRGVGVYIEPAALPFVSAIVERSALFTDGGQDALIALDFGKQNAAFKAKRDELITLLSSLRVASPNAVVALCASSFPDSFVSLPGQEIFERSTFEEVRSSAGEWLIYGDRGSARAERQIGGGGLPAPRIDFPRRKDWRFFRDDALTGIAGYQAQAISLMKDDAVWDEKLKLWGTQMIERTALGDDTAIISPNRSTAARINIHLHQQLYFDDPDSLYDTDELWED